LAGGTAVVGPVDDETETVIDLSGLGLAYIRPDGPAVALGAMTTLAGVLESPALQQAGAGILSQAVLHTGPTTLLNRATIGGALARPDRAGELVAALLALDGRILTRRLGVGGSVVREGMELGAFLHHRPEVLRTAIIEEVQIPTAPVSAALERVARTPRDEATVSVAAVVQYQDDRCHTARIAATGLSSQPERLKAVEALLEGVPLTDEQIIRAATAAGQTMEPPDDFRGGTDYRRHLAGVLVRRALEKARELALAGRKE
jgi:carbon-monoxide dehydrogenase medium subunit